MNNELIKLTIKEITPETLHTRITNENQNCITYLNITKNPINTLLLNKFTFNTLSVLNQSFNELKKIDCPINPSANLILKALILNNNSISLIENLDRYVNLNTLILSYNEIKNLSGLPSLTKLLKFSIAHNQLTTTSDLPPLPALKELRINDNLIKTLDFSTLPKGIEILDLAGNQINDLNTLLSGLKEFPCLVNLNLKKNPFYTSDNMEEVDGKVKAALPNLRILNNQRFDSKFLERKLKISDDRRGFAEKKEFNSLCKQLRLEGKFKDTRDTTKKGKKRKVDQKQQEEEKPEEVLNPDAIIEKMKKKLKKMSKPVVELDESTTMERSKKSNKKTEIVVEEKQPSKTRKNHKESSSLRRKADSTKKITKSVITKDTKKSKSISAKIPQSQINEDDPFFLIQKPKSPKIPPTLIAELPTSKPKLPPSDLKLNSAKHTGIVGVEIVNHDKSKKKKKAEEVRKSAFNVEELEKSSVEAVVSGWD